MTQQSWGNTYTAYGQWYDTASGTYPATAPAYDSHGNVYYYTYQETSSSGRHSIVTLRDAVKTTVQYQGIQTLGKNAGRSTNSYTKYIEISHTLSKESLSNTKNNYSSYNYYYFTINLEAANSKFSTKYNGSTTFKYYTITSSTVVNLYGASVKNGYTTHSSASLTLSVSKKNIQTLTNTYSTYEA